MSWNTAEAQPSPSRDVRQTPESFDQLGGLLTEQLSRLRSVAHDTHIFADRLCGASPEGKTDGPKPVGSGYVEKFSIALQDLDGIVNEILHHHGRISRALAEG